LHRDYPHAAQQELSCSRKVEFGREFRGSDFLNSDDEIHELPVAGEKMTRADRAKTQDTAAAAVPADDHTSAGSGSVRRTARSLDAMQETASPLADSQGQLLEQTLKTRSRRKGRSGSAADRTKAQPAAPVTASEIREMTAEQLLFQVICESGLGSEVQIPETQGTCPGNWNSQISAAPPISTIPELPENSDRLQTVATARLIAAELKPQLNSHFEQLGAALHSQLSELLREMAGKVLQPEPASTPARSRTANSATEIPDQARLKTAPEPIGAKAGQREPAGPAARNLSKSWEEIRQELFDEVERKSDAGYLADLPIDLPSEPAPPTGMRDAVFSPAEGGYVPADFSPSDDLVMTEVPQQTELEKMSSEELRTLLHQREALMARLIYRLRCREETRLNLLTMDQLRTMQRELPQELAAIVESSVRRSDNLTRLGELELAFERARLTREKNNLQQSRQLIDVLARQIGFVLNSDGTLVRQVETQPKTSSRRWLGKLGFGQQGRD